MAYYLRDLLHARGGTRDVYHVAGLHVDVPFERQIDTQTLNSRDEATLTGGNIGEAHGELLHFRAQQHACSLPSL